MSQNFKTNIASVYFSGEIGCISIECNRMEENVRISSDEIVRLQIATTESKPQTVLVLKT